VAEFSHLGCNFNPLEVANYFLDIQIVDLEVGGSIPLTRPTLFPGFLRVLGYERQISNGQNCE